MKWRAALVMFAAIVTPASAQQDSLMQEAVRLASDGMSDSARTVVAGRLAQLSAQDPEYAEVLFTYGLVSDSTDSRIRIFRQVSIEYSDSDWADRALLMLAQHAFAAGDLQGVTRSANRILLDYPFSPIRGQAAFWAGRAQLDLNNLAAACDLLDQARRESGENIELANRAGFYLQRCADVGAAPSDSAETPTPPSGGAPTFAVQVAAVSSAAAADEAMRSVTEAGHPARVFRDEDGLLKVRVGRFTRRADAEALARQLRRELGGRPFVVEEPR